MATSAPAREELAHVRIVRELGARAPGTYLGHREDEPRDVVLETYANLDPKSMRVVFETARRLHASPKHPHLVAVIAADRIGSGISIVTDYVDGVPLDRVFFGMSLGARLRAVVDVLSALSALHMVPDGAPVVHGGILLRSAFVEKTGRTKLGFAYREPKKESYAPEVLLGDDSAIDPRSDVYGAGVLLWEAINGDALFGDAKAEDVVREQLSGRIAKPHVPLREKWASRLVPVAERALAIDPKARYASVAEMAAALRIAVRARLMTHEDVIEDLWPAETKPKHSSGIVPVAPDARPAAPIVAEAAPQTPPESASRIEIEVEPSIAPTSMDPSPPAEGAASGIVPVAPIAETKPRVAPAPTRRGRTFFVFALAACLVALAAAFAHFRVSRIAARPDATPDEPVPTSTIGAPERPAVEREDTRPTSAPAASGTTAPTATAPQHKTKPAKRLARPSYDPSSI